MGFAISLNFVVFAFAIIIAINIAFPIKLMAFAIFFTIIISRIIISTSVRVANINTVFFAINIITFIKTTAFMVFIIRAYTIILVTIIFISNITIIFDIITIIVVVFNCVNVLF